MTRVEWSALGGDEVETLLANLFYNRNGRFLRIRPAQGDFGIDLLLPVEHDPQRWDVYQIKKFALNLDANQKSQIEASFRRVLVAFVRHQLKLNNWYVVMPLDPTPLNLTWFEKMPEAAYTALAADEKLALTTDELRQIREWLDTPGREIGWKGLAACESLAADYPYVVDYYLHGGQQRIRDAVADISKMLHVDMRLQLNEAAAPPTPTGHEPVALLTPGEITEHLQRLGRALDTDPHFLYAHSLDVTRPELEPEPNLVAATQQQLAGGRWLTFKIYVRSAQSLDERPIPLTLEFDFESPEDLQALEIWHKYGKPAEVPASLDADMPGGLPRGGRSGRVQLAPAADVLTQARIRLRIVDTAATPIAECMFVMSSAPGTGGMWARGTDESGTLTVEFLIDTTTGATTADFRIESLAGRQAGAALDAIVFAGHLATPNVLHLAAEYGPFNPVTPLTTSDPLLPPAVVRFVQDLAVIQTVTPTPVVIPDVTAMNNKQLHAVRRAAAMINGHTQVGTWKPLTVAQVGDTAFDPAGRHEFMVADPLIVELGSLSLVLGTQQSRLASARIEPQADGSARLVPDENDIVHYSFSPQMPEDGKRNILSRRISDREVADS